MNRLLRLRRVGPSFCADRRGALTARGAGAILLGVWLLTGPLLAAEMQARGAPENLVPRPGFEASEASLAKTWQGHGADFQVDRGQKHSGNQSIRLEASGKNPGAVAHCTLPGNRIKTPTTLVISAWSKAQGITGRADGNYAIYIDVNYTDGTNLYGPNAPFGTGTHDWEYRAVQIPLPKPVARVSINLVLRGDHAGTAWFDDVYAAPHREGSRRYEGSSLAYTTPPRVEESRRKVAALAGKIASLDRSIQAAEARGLELPDARVSLAVARLFAEFISKDAELEVEDFPKDMIDFRILGKKETLQRIEDLPGFQTRETERVLDRAIEEVRKAAQDAAPRAKTPRVEAGRVGIRDGAFCVDGKPLFLSGILGMPWSPEQEERMDVAKALGANLLGPVHVSHAAFRGWDQFDESYFPKHIFPQYRAAAAKGFWVSPSMWNYHAPAWLAKLAPDIGLDEDHGWFRDHMDLEHPLTGRLNRVWFAYAAAQLKKMPNNFCYSLMGEEWCHPGFRGKYTTQRYEDWLKAKHATVDALNQAWGTKYANFQEAATRGSLQTKDGHYDEKTLAPGGKEHLKTRQTRGQFYDWHAYNEDRLTAFNQSQIDGLKAAEPDGLWTCWPAAGCLVSAPLGGFDPQYGRNREDILRQSSVCGWDGGIFAVEAGASTRRLPESHWAKYSLGWRDEMIYYDFAKSVCPEKPIFDPELHTITSVYHISPLGVSADYFRTTLWMEHLHGLGAHLLWWWGRAADGTPRYGEFLGGLLTQPQLLDAWGRTVLELRRLTDYVVLFPQLERKVRILYSEASAIQDRKAYPLAVRDAYEALYFLDYPVGFVTERMVREGKLAECSLLVIPAANYVGDQTVAKIGEYCRQGGRVAIIGRESLQCDEYANPRKSLDFLKEDLYLAGSTPEEYAPQLDKLLDLAGVRRPVRLAGKDGGAVWGVELRTAIREGKPIVSLVNVAKQPVEIVLKAKGDLGKSRDLVADRPVSLQGPLVLEPRKPMLLELPQ